VLRLRYIAWAAAVVLFVLALIAGCSAGVAGTALGVAFPVWMASGLLALAISLGPDIR
jgi:hypothetical protein